MTVPLLLEAFVMPCRRIAYYRPKCEVSQSLSLFGMTSMNRKMSIGSIIGAVLIGGMVVYSGQHNAIAASDEPSRAETLISGTTLADTMTATSSIAATGIASDMTSSTATLHGMVYPQGTEISYWFEYTSDPLLGLILIRKTSRVLLITDSNQKLVEADVSGLTEHTKYYFRIVTENGVGVERGGRAFFNTK